MCDSSRIVICCWHQQRRKEGRKEIMSEGIRSKAGAGTTQVIIRQEVNTTRTLLAEEETVTDLPCVN
jgi:hypothetical protein